MDKDLPRIETVTVERPSTLRVRSREKSSTDAVNLTGWKSSVGRHVGYRDQIGPWTGHDFRV
jgi:hypothetical protein